MCMPCKSLGNQQLPCRAWPGGQNPPPLELGAQWPLLAWPGGQNPVPAPEAPDEDSDDDPIPDAEPEVDPTPLGEPVVIPLDEAPVLPDVPELLAASVAPAPLG